MPSVSRKQQRFMGMVHADQEGKLKHPSADISRAAGSMSHQAASDFASTSHSGLPERSRKDEMSEILETIAQYNEMGKALRRTSSIREIGAKLSHMAEMAERAVVSEADDWFDAKTLQRNMKELKTYAEAFSKSAEEADILEQRMTALYDDVGRILERYFEIPEHEQPEVEIADGLPKTELPSDPGAGELAVKNESGERFRKLKGKLSHEKGISDPAALAASIGRKKYGAKKFSQMAHHEGAVREDGDSAAFSPSPQDSLQVGTTGHTEVPSQNMDGEGGGVDPLTIRAIAVVYEFLKKNKPELAQRFKDLPAKKMAQVVWKMVK